MDDSQVVRARRDNCAASGHDPTNSLARRWHVVCDARSDAHPGGNHESTRPDDRESRHLHHSRFPQSRRPHFVGTRLWLRARGRRRGQVVGTITDRDICMAAYTQGKRLSELPIATVMPHEVFSCSPDDSSEVAESIMQRHQVRRLPVIDRTGKLVGVLSVNDLATKQAPPREIAKTLTAICQPRGHATAA